MFFLVTDSILLFLCSYLPFLFKFYSFFDRHPLFSLYFKLSFYFIFFNVLHIYLDSPILCMPNPDFDCSSYPGVPVEIGNSSTYDIPATARKRLSPFIGFSLVSHSRIKSRLAFSYPSRRAGTGPLGLIASNVRILDKVFRT